MTVREAVFGEDHVLEFLTGTYLNVTEKTESGGGVRSSQFLGCI